MNEQGEDEIAEKAAKRKKPESSGGDKLDISNIEFQHESSTNDVSNSDATVEKSSKTELKSQLTRKVEDYDTIVASIKDATSSFKEGIIFIAEEIKDKAEKTFTVGEKKDAREIQALGGYVDNVVKAYEATVKEIEKRNYAEQEKLLKGYKKILEGQINLLKAKIEMAKRLKSTMK